MKADVNFYEEIIHITLPLTFAIFKNLIGHSYVLPEGDVDELIFFYDHQNSKLPIANAEDYKKLLKSPSSLVKITIEVNVKSKLFLQEEKNILDVNPSQTLWNNQGERVKEIFEEQGEKVKELWNNHSAKFKEIIIDQGEKAKALWDNPNELYNKVKQGQDYIYNAIQQQGEKAKALWNNPNDLLVSMKNGQEQIMKSLHVQAEIVKNFLDNQNAKVSDFKEKHSDTFKAMEKIQNDIIMTMQVEGNKIKELLISQGLKVNEMLKNQEKKEHEFKELNLSEQEIEIQKNEMLKYQLMKEQVQKGIIHYHVQCDQCKVAPIKGTRYKCTVCPNYDYCENCEKTFGEAHGHPMMKIRNPQCNPYHY